MRLTLAAVHARSGAAFGPSVSGEPRGPACGMGVCHDCRVTIDGERELACLMLHEPPPADATAAPGEERCDVVVVGGGAAGLAAARAAEAAGADVLLLDEHAALGGPIYRAVANPWQPPARVRHGARVIAALPDGLLAEDRAGALIVRHRAMVIATGSRELLLPFPGWTLPGVFGAGGLQLLAKGGWPVAGKRVVVAGTGPLLRAAAVGLRQLGARVIAIAELAPRARVAGFGLRLVAYPGKLAQAAALSARLIGVPVWYESFVRRVHGTTAAARVTVDIAGRERTVDCDLVAVGFGLVPNLELAELLGCAVERGRVVVDPHGATSVPGVYAAGEVTGIGGVDKAIVEGAIAGAAAAGQRPAARLVRRRRRALAFGDALAACFPPPADWARVVDDDTIVCRCEDVRWGALRTAHDLRAARLHARAGMGACQGRICGTALAVLRGFTRGAVRPPLTPTRLETLTR